MEERERLLLPLAQLLVEVLTPTGRLPSDEEPTVSLRKQRRVCTTLYCCV